MKLEQIVPLGRGLGEYRAMFALRPADRSRRILGCGDGPAAFNADWTGEGGRVVSLDPLYAVPAAEVARRIDATFPDVLARMHAAPERFRLGHADTIDALARRRRAAMQRFLADYPVGAHAGRYVAGALPRLPLADDSFDLALVAHLLFLYEDHLSRAFHLAALRELLRVAGEARVFPLINLAGEISAHLDPVRAGLSARGVRSEVVAVDYEVQRGARHMLRLWRAHSERGR